MCVQAGFPHLAIHSAPREIGSRADVEILKKTARSIEPLTITSTGKCAIMGDKGYITSEQLPFTVITPKRQNMQGFNREENFRIALARVHVERFFGRLKSTWKILSEKYRRSHSAFDKDFDTLVVLTNRLIVSRPQPTESEQTKWGNVYKHIKQRYRVEYLERKAKISRAAVMRMRAEVEAETDDVAPSEEEYDEDGDEDWEPGDLEDEDMDEALEDEDMEDEAFAVVDDTEGQTDSDVTTVARMGDDVFCDRN